MENVLQQFTRFWSQLGVNQKVSLVLTTIFVVSGMVAIFMWANRSQMALLYGNLNPDDMSEIVSKIQDQDVDYEIRSGNAIFVQRDTVYSLRMELASAGLPQGEGVGFEIFDQTNFGISDFVQKTNYARALQGELARTITQLNGIRAARVMVALPENKLLLDGKKQGATASVFVETGGSKLPLEAVNSIRFLVSNSVEDLAVDDVAVIDNMGNVLSESLRTDDNITEMTGQLKYRKEIESYYTDRIQMMLEKVLGAGNVVARVSADIDVNGQTKVETVYDPDSQVVRTQTVSEDTSSTNEAKSQGGAGTSANVEDADSGLVANSLDKRTDKTTTYEINSSKVEVIRNPGNINELSASVFVAAVRNAESGEIISRTQEEINRLVKLVGNALGVTNVDELERLVSVEELVFSVPEYASTVEADNFIDLMIRYEEFIRQMFAIGLALVIFLIFARMVKKYRPDLNHADSVVEINAEPREISPRLTPELLNELIKTKPENVGTALKKWAEETGKG